MYCKEIQTMYEILKKQRLNPTVTLMEINAPLVAKKAEPGQFIILRVNADEKEYRLQLRITIEKKARSR